MREDENEEEMSEEVRRMLIRCIHNRRVPVRCKYISLSKIEIPPDRSLMHRKAQQTLTQHPHHAQHPLQHPLQHPHHAEHPRSQSALLPARRRTAQLSSLSYGSLVPKI